MAVQNRKAKNQPDIKSNEIEEKEIEELLEEASQSQKKQMDAEGVFVSEQLIAATMQKLEQTAQTDATQTEPLKRQTIDKKQLGRIAALVAAVFAVVLLARGGVWMLSEHRNQKGDTDGAGMQESEENNSNFYSKGDMDLDSINSPNSAGYPEAVPTKAEDSADADHSNMNNAQPSDNSGDGCNASVPFLTAETYLSAVSGKEEVMLLLQKPEGQAVLGGVEQSGCFTAEEGTEPWLLYEDKAFLAVQMEGADEEVLQIVFDEPQNFLYSCGREGECFYLLATRKTAEGSYEHQLLLFDWEANQTKTWELPGEGNGLVSWISLQDGELFYK